MEFNTRQKGIPQQIITDGTKVIYTLNLILSYYIRANGKELMSAVIIVDVLESVAWAE